MLFRFETVVVLLVMGGGVWAEGTTSITTGNAESDQQKAADIMCSKGPEWDAQCKTALQKLQDGASSTDCGYPDFLDAEKKLQDACGKVSVPNGDCASAFAQCTSDKAEGVKATKHDSHGSIDVAGAKRKYKTCPAMASADLDAYEKKLDQAEKDIKKDQERVDTLEEDRTKHADKHREKINDLKKEMSKNAADHSKDVVQAQDDQNQKEQDLVKQMNEVRGNLEKANEAIRNNSLNTVSANNTLAEAKAKIDEDCYNQASGQVNMLQTQVIASMKTNTYARGGFNQMLKNVGMSDRQAWQRVANKYYLWCKSSQPTRDAKASANRAYGQSLDGINANTLNLMGQRDALNQQMQQISNGACTGQATGAMNGESQMCQMARAATAHQKQAEGAFGVIQNAAQQEMDDEAKAGDAEWRKDTASLDKINRTIKDEQTRMDNLQQLLNAKYAAGATTSSDAKDLQGAMSAFIHARVEAESVVDCNVRKATKVGPACESNTCTLAYQFLGTAGVKKLPATKVVVPFTSADLNSGSGGATGKAVIDTEKDTGGADGVR